MLSHHQRALTRSEDAVAHPVRMQRTQSAAGSHVSKIEKPSLQTRLPRSADATAGCSKHAWLHAAFVAVTLFALELVSSLQILQTAQAYLLGSLLNVSCYVGPVYSRCCYCLSAWSTCSQTLLQSQHKCLVSICNTENLC